MFFILHEGGGSQELSARLAANLRRLRIASRHSLSELARATEISKATLSGIERGAGNPTVQTLAALAGALRVGVADLLEEPPAGEVRIVRAAGAEARTLERMALRGLDRERLDGQLDISEMRLPAGCVHEVGALAPGARVHLLVLEGRLIAGPSERISELSAGDYCSFPAEQPCVYEAGAAAARVLLMTLSPS
jgi:transcriptional regulator with XRE-family HTH domain